MRAHSVLPLVVLAAGALIVAVSIGNQAANVGPVTTDELIKFYEACIDRTILICQSKISRYSSSKSKEIQKAVKMFSDKKGFLMNNKQALINKMLANNIEKKHYKVNYFLDRAFFQDVRQTGYPNSILKAASNNLAQNRNSGP